MEIWILYARIVDSNFTNLNGVAMCKKSKVIAIVLLSASVSFASIVEHTYSFKQNKIEMLANGYSKVHLEDAVFSNRVGEPCIPYASVNLLLPPGEIVDYWEIIGSDTVEIPGSIKIFPFQAEVNFSRRIDKNSFIKNDSIYNLSGIYPGQSKGKLTTQYYNNFPIAMGAFSPILYYPAKEKCFLIQTIKVKIYTKPETNHIRSYNNDNKARFFLSSLVKNPDMLNQYSFYHSGSKERMLIVTSKIFLSGFIPLVNYHNSNGIECSIAFVEDIINDEAGLDEQEKIRNKIIKEKNSSEIKYVLLGGDVDIVKARKFLVKVETTDTSGEPITDTGSAVADIYYAGIDGNWDKNGNKIYGEKDDECDMLPELSVGRLPFSSADEQTNLISKIINYQSSPIQGELNKPLLAGETADDVTPASPIMENLIGEKDFYGFQTTGIPISDNIQKLYDGSNYFWSNSDIIAKINDGTSAIYHSGHADVIYSLRLHISEITDSLFSKVNGVDKNYTIINTVGCNSGDFEIEDCIAEKMLTIKNLAVAFIGNSWYGWYDNGTADGPSIRLQRLFVHALYTENLTNIGDAHLYSKVKFSPMVDPTKEFEPGARRSAYYTCNLMGDPAMSVWIKNNQNTAIRNDALVTQLRNKCDLKMLTTKQSEIKVQFTLTKSSDIHLSLIDYKGRKVSELANGIQSSGSHVVSINKNNYAGGLYFVELSTHDHKEYKVVNLLK